jgi:hypothetical protein
LGNLIGPPPKFRREKGAAIPLPEKEILVTKSLLRASTLAFLLALSATHAHGATVSLLDQFDDGNLATNGGIGGVGNGFTTDWIDCGTGTGVSSSELDGKASVDGASCVHWMQSNDAIDPTGTTMIWSIDSLPSTTSQGAYVGWVQAGQDACCETGIYLGIEGHRVTLDMQAKTGNDPYQAHGRYFEILAGSTTPGEVYPGYSAGPLTAILSLDATGWQVSIHGAGVEIVKSGTYSSCLTPSSGQCIGLSNVLAFPGVNGTLRPVAGAFREHESAEFGSVLVISN